MASHEPSLRSDLDEVVGWDGPSDPQNPLNFSPALKITNTVLITAVCCVNIMALAILAPGVPVILREFPGGSSILSSLVVSIYILGLGSGPLIFAPLSELIGRVPVYHLSVLGFVFFNILCAKASSLEMLVALRFFTGVFGSVTETNGGATVSDLYTETQRGALMAVYSVGPVIAGIVSPVIGGYVAENLGWRWIFWLMAILSGVFGLLGAILLKETYAPVILRRKKSRNDQEKGDLVHRPASDNQISPSEEFLRAVVRPTKLLIYSPIIISTALFLGIMIGEQLLMVTTVTPVFQEGYHFSTSAVGLMYLGSGSGSLLGVILFGWVSNRNYQLQQKSEGSEDKPFAPEDRLVGIIPAYLLVPIGTIIYGWSAEKQVHWIVPIIGMAINSLGSLYVFVSLLVYIIDCFPLYAASASTGGTFLRNILGTTLPMIGPALYKAFKVGWTNTLLALLATLMVPYLWALQRWSARLRVKYDVKNL